MTIQDAAHKLLQEEGHPLKPEDLAKRAREQGLVESQSEDPIFSLQSTLRKNCRPLSDGRDGPYNQPKLLIKYLPGQRGMFLALPEWETQNAKTKDEPSAQSEERKIRIPVELIKQVELVKQADIAKTFDDALAFLIRKGWSIASPEIKAALNKFFNDDNRGQRVFTPGDPNVPETNQSVIEKKKVRDKLEAQFGRLFQVSPRRPGWLARDQSLSVFLTYSNEDNLWYDVGELDLASFMNDYRKAFIIFIVGSHDETLVIPVDEMRKHLVQEGLKLAQDGTYKLHLEASSAGLRFKELHKLDVNPYRNAFHLMDRC